MNRIKIAQALITYIGFFVFVIASIGFIVPGIWADAWNPIVLLVAIIAGWKTWEAYTQWKTMRPTLYVLFILTAVAVLIVSIDAVAIEPYSIQIREQHFDFFEHGEPVKIVLISDTQEAYDYPEYFAGVIDKINAQEPDLVLIAGDITDGEYRGWEKLGELGRLESNGAYAVLGNHDYRRYFINKNCPENDENMAYANNVEDSVEELGIYLLRNEHQILEVKGHELVLIGLDDLWGCQSNYSKATANLSSTAPRIVLTHIQEAIDYDDLEGKNLILAGHTHCGQVRLPFIGSVPKMLGFRGDVDMGRSRIDTDNEIYVTCGVIPGIVRLGAPPEITVIYLD